MLTVIVGAAEARFGTRTASCLFFGVHFVTMIAEYTLAVVPLRSLGYPLGDALHLAYHVGPSAGYYG